MVAAEGFMELHSTEEVRSCVLPSVKVPNAANTSLTPLGNVEFAGVTARRTSAAAVTFNVALPEIDPEDPLIVLVPTASLTASPLLPIAATAGAEDAHETDGVMTFVLPFV
jgi:hypothetical protein